MRRSGRRRVEAIADGRAAPCRRARVSDFLATLQPKTEAQKAALATASQYASMVEQSRLLDLFADRERPGVVGSDRDPGLLDRGALLRHRPVRPKQRLGHRCPTFGALSIAFAIFLILELGLPYTGLFGSRPRRSSKRSSSSTSSRSRRRPETVQPRAAAPCGRGPRSSSHRSFRRGF